MPATSPEEICRLFKEAMAKGDLDAVLSVYDAEAVFLNQSREVTKRREDLRRELVPLVTAKTVFEYDVRQVVESGDIALMHTKWRVSTAQPMTVYAIEVARRQRDGSWRWLIGDPYTVRREVGS
jgi:ketosteroid isomerase-like protein